MFWLAVPATIGMLILGVCLVPWGFKRMLEIMMGPAGEFRKWHTTVRHSAGPVSANDYWNAAISELEQSGACLLREWNSRGETGDRKNREYLMDNKSVLLELDRWNGFTISGNRFPVESIIGRITHRLETA